MKIDRICRKFLFWDKFLKIAYREIKDLRYQENSQTEICDRSAWIDNFEDTYLPFKKLETAVQEFRTYIERNGRFIPNYGERWRYGEAIATGIVESTVN
jgi:hypothetical protein